MCQTVHIQHTGKQNVPSPWVVLEPKDEHYIPERVMSSQIQEFESQNWTLDLDF